MEKKSNETMDSSEVTQRMKASSEEDPNKSRYFSTRAYSQPPSSSVKESQIKSQYASVRVKQQPESKPEQALTTSITQRSSVATVNLQKIMRENAKQWCKRVTTKGIEGLKAEFMAMKKAVDPSLIKSFLKHQQPIGVRNRYRDVPCLDKSRVVLKNSENDYIHANFVSSPQNEKRFICTQGPTDRSIVDFWRMIVQERSNVIIMLCNLQEKGVKKCTNYFPSKVNECMTFENFTVICKVQKNLDLPKGCTQKIKIVINGLIVTDKKANTIHYVDHYYWVDWPDRGIPPTDLTPVNLLNVVRPCRYPIVVHCSAGVGRTGSIVMIEYIIELFLTGKSFERGNEVLAKIREQRASSIQTYQQYLYVHRVMLEYFYRLNMLDASQLPHIKKFCDDYNKAIL